jgi:hypothetical protein
MIIIIRIMILAMARPAHGREGIQRGRDCQVPCASLRKASAIGRWTQQPLELGTLESQPHAPRHHLLGFFFRHDWSILMAMRRQESSEW